MILDPTKTCPWDNSMLFSGRHYIVLHLLNPGEYDQRSTVAELKDRMK